jgi:hypothetical protein
MAGLKDFIEEFDLGDEEKLNKMASVKASAGGRLQLPGIGQAVTVRIASEPQKIEADALKERGIEKSWVCKVNVVEDGKVSDVDFDLFISKTIAQGMVVALKRDYGKEFNDLSDLVGRVFTIAGVEWKDAPAEYRERGKKVKTYRTTGRPDIEEKLAGVVEAEELDIEL